MKVEITSKGGLSIYSEDALESYALTKWWEDWSAHKVTLGIVTYDSTSDFTSSCRMDVLSPDTSTESTK